MPIKVAKTTKITQISGMNSRESSRVDVMETLTVMESSMTLVSLFVKSVLIEGAGFSLHQDLNTHITCVPSYDKSFCVYLHDR